MMLIWKGFLCCCFFNIIFVMLKFIVLIDACNRCKTNSCKVHDRHEEQTI